MTKCDYLLVIDTNKNSIDRYFEISNIDVHNLWYLKIRECLPSTYLKSACTIVVTFYFASYTKVLKYHIDILQ